MNTRTLITVVILALVFMAGCQEEQGKWGKGDPPDGWQVSFGNDNIARLNFLQSQLIDSQQKLLYGYNHTDPDGKPTLDKEGKPARVIGVVEYLNAVGARVESWPDPNVIEDLTERIKALEAPDPNTPDIESITFVDADYYIEVLRHTVEKVNEIIERLNQ